MALGDSYLDTILTDYDGSQIAPQPWYYFRLSDAPGATVAKSLSVLGATMLDRTATVVGGVTFDQPGAIDTDPEDKSALFDGSSGYITIPNDSILDNIVNAWTIEAWVYATATRGAATEDMSGIISREITTSGAIPFALSYGTWPALSRPANTVGGGFWNGTNWANVNDTSPLPLNTWVYFALTWDGTTLRLYRNGVQVNAGAPGFANAAAPAGRAAFIGRRWDAANPTAAADSFFPGRIDEVAIYSVAKNAEQIARHYNTAKGIVQSRKTFIGKRWDLGGTTPYFPGRLDEVAVYDYALSPQQIATHYSAGVTAEPGPPEPVVEVAFDGAPTSDYRDTAMFAPFGAFIYHRFRDPAGSTVMHGENWVNGTDGDGVYQGTPTLEVASALPFDADDAAMTLNGTSQWAESYRLGARVNPSAGSGETWMIMEAWIKPEDLNNKPIMEWSDGTNRKSHFWLFPGNDGALYVNFCDVSGVFHAVQQPGGNPQLADGAWHHVAAGYDGTYGYLFLDGQEVHRVNLGAIQIDVGNATTLPNLRLFIGKQPIGTPSYFAGSIDEVAVYMTNYQELSMPELIALHYGTRLVPRPLTWTDITEFVRGHSALPSGRNYELDRYETGTATIIVNNDDRRFEPGYTGTIANYSTNPSFEKDANAWQTFVVGGGTSAIAQADPGPAGARVGSKVAEVTWNGASGAVNITQLPADAVPVEAGTQVTLRASLCSRDAAITDLDIFARTYDAAGVLMNQVDLAIDQLFPTIDTWYDLEGTYTAQAGEAFVAIQVYVGGPASTDLTVHLDRVQVVETSKDLPYIDGDTDNCRWDTVAHASRSFFGGPYYPHVTNGKPVRIRELKDGVYYPLFQGWADKWPLSWPDGQPLGIAQIEASDAFGLLQKAKLSYAASRERAGARVAAAITRLPFPNVAAKAFAVLDGVWGTGCVLEAETFEGAFSAQIMQAAADSEAGEVYVSRDGHIMFRTRRYRIGKPSLGTFGEDEDAGEIGYEDLAPSEDNAVIVNDVRVTATGGIEQAVQDWDSIVVNGRQSRSLSTSNFSDGEAVKAGRAIMETRANPALRFDKIKLTIPTLALDDNAKLVQALTRDVGDRITVIRRPDDNPPPMTDEVLISKIEYKRTPDQLVVVWSLIPAP